MMNFFFRISLQPERRCGINISNDTNTMKLGRWRQRAVSGGERGWIHPRDSAQNQIETYSNQNIISK
jgi:hypothetical protein